MLVSQVLPPGVRPGVATVPDPLGDSRRPSVALVRVVHSAAAPEVPLGELDGNLESLKDNSSPRLSCNKCYFDSLPT